MARHFLMAMVVALVGTASPASAATVLLSDDAEGAIEDKWVVDKPANDKIQPWQPSSSPTAKFRGNQFHGGLSSYWSGVTPADNHPVDVIEGTSTITTKTPIIVPSDGKTTISVWSLFQNESDDQGLIEVAVDTGAGKLAWKRIAGYTPDATAGTGLCLSTNPAGFATQGFEELTGDLAAFRGKSVFVRVNLKYGGSNPVVTQPCGWYVDDIKIETTGTPGLTGTSAPSIAGPTLSAPSTAGSTVKLASLRGKGKQAKVKLTVGGAAIKDVVMTLFRGRLELHQFRAANIPVGTRTITFKTRKKLKKGAITLKLSATGGDGAKVKAVGKGKAR